MMNKQQECESEINSNGNNENDIVVKQHNAILEFLRSTGLIVETIETNKTNKTKFVGLEGQIIPRDLLILPGKYEECQPKLKNIRECMSSSRLSCLQTTAEINQRWPLLNAVRQLLRSQNYKMTPFRISDGYTKDGKKILRRFFRIEKIKQIQDKTITSSNIVDNVDNVDNDNE